MKGRAMRELSNEIRAASLDKILPLTPRSGV